MSSEQIYWSVLVFSTDGKWKVRTRSFALWALMRDNESYVVDVQLIFF